MVQYIVISNRIEKIISLNLLMITKKWVNLSTSIFFLNSCLT